MPNSSQAWKSICEGAEFIEELSWQVGIGRNIDALNDKWLGSKSIYEMDTMVEIIPQGTMVCDRIDVNREWNLQKFAISISDIP